MYSYCRSTKVLTNCGGNFVLCFIKQFPNFSWFSQLEATRWFHHMSGLMRAAVTLVTAVERDARPVMVHCSDGWDRTPQIVALAELLLDPYYRTIDVCI